jgi:hypothetical protein
MTGHLYDEGKEQQFRKKERDRQNNRVKKGSKSSSSQNRNTK